MSLHRLHFLLLLIVVSAMAQTFQYSRGWTNGRKRSDSTFLQQQQPTQQQHGRPNSQPNDLVSNSAEDWSRSKTNNEEVNEDGERLVYGNHCAKLVSLLDSVLKNNDIKSDEPIINLH